jgi:outer membrane protein assembly factor BamD
MNTHRLTVFVVAALALVAAGCGSGGKEDPILSLSAAESLAEGKRLFEGEKYRQARPYLQHAFEVEPNSATGREALLMVADALFAEGNDTDLVQAEAKYRDFQNRFPTSERAAYVQARIAASLAERMERPDRDQEVTRKALAAYEDLLRLYPTSPEAATAAEPLREVRSNLAEHELVVGRFYQRFGLPGAAASRLEYLLASFPEYEKRDLALYQLGLSYRALKKPDEAQAAFSRLRAEHPDSPWIAEIPAGAS